MLREGLASVLNRIRVSERGVSTTEYALCTLSSDVVEGDVEGAMKGESQLDSSVPAVPETPRGRKATGQYPTLRAALAKAVINRVAQEGGNRSETEAALRVDDLVETTEKALISYCCAVFDNELTKLRLELVTSELDRG
jgi:hypothetical protein